MHEAFPRHQKSDEIQTITKETPQMKTPAFIDTFV